MKIWVWSIEFSFYIFVKVHKMKQEAKTASGILLPEASKKALNMAKVQARILQKSFQKRQNGIRITNFYHLFHKK